MASATIRELLRSNSNFRNLWGGQVISELGMWFSFIAELGLVRMFSGSPLATTALLVARLLPYLLVAPLAGVVVDRVSRKRIMIVADIVRAVIALFFLVAAARQSVWGVCACSGAIACTGVFFEAAKNASLPNLTQPRELLTANVLMFSTRFLQLTLGAALGGLTAATLGYEVAFVVESLCFLGSAGFILLIPPRSMHRPGAQVWALPAPETVDPDTDGDPISSRRGHGNFIADVRAGMSYILATPFVRAVILLNIGWATGGGMTYLLYDRMGGSLFVSGPDDRGDWNVALLTFSGGAGLFLGMLMARRAGAWVSATRRAGLFIGWSLVVYGLCFASAGLMPGIYSMALLVSVSRFIIGMEFGVQETLMMRVLPDDYRGRVFTTDRALEYATMSLSMIIGGWLLTSWGARMLMVISGLISAIPGILWLGAVRFWRFSVPARAIQEE